MSPHPGTRTAGWSAAGVDGRADRRALLPRHRMGVVEPDQPLAIGSMQGERVVDSMRLLRRSPYACHHESDPVAAARVHHENLPVEIKKQIEGQISHRGDMVITLKQREQGRAGITLIAFIADASALVRPALAAS